jgi:E3 ubiquitin-protein ligase synoviolin
MDQIPPPGPPALFHVRTSVIICLLTLADLVLVTYSLESILLDGVSAMVLFGSEFMILLASISGTTARYVIGLMDLRRARGRVDAPSWEAKSMYLFYVDLATGMCRLCSSRRLAEIVQTSPSY